MRNCSIFEQDLQVALGMIEEGLCINNVPHNKFLEPFLMFIGQSVIFQWFITRSKYYSLDQILILIFN